MTVKMPGSDSFVHSWRARGFCSIITNKMFVLAHAGITLGSALLLDNILSKASSKYELEHCNTASSALPSTAYPVANRANSNPPWFTFLARRIDYRLVLIGSLLPDIIDKPLGTFLSPDFFGANRIFCHTLLFLVILSSVGVYLFKSRGQTWLLALSFGTFIHLILDAMWLMPQTFLWPIYGWAFERTDLSNWLQSMLYALRSNPAIYISELVGLALLVGILVQLTRKKKLLLFIKKGAILC